MNKITTSSIISYSLLAFCLSFVGLPIYIYLPNYYADNFDVSLKTMAVILLATRLFDTISDPIFGIVSDKVPHLKKKIICYFSPFLGIAFLFLFQPMTQISINFWLITFLLVTYGLFSLIYINYQSFAVSLSDDYHLKTRIISYREICFILGIICAAAGPAILFEYFSETKSFFLMGVVYLVLITIFSVIFYINAPANEKLKISKSVNGGNILVIIKNQSLRKYFTIFFLNSVSSSIPAVLIIFFVEEIINAKSLVGIFLILYFFGLLIGVIFWTKISKFSNNKIRTWLASIISTIFIFVWCYFLTEGDIILYGIICILSGLCFGGDFALAYSVLTDMIQKNKLENNESTIFGITNFIVKISLTLSSAILIYYIGDLESDLYAKKQFISFSYALLPIIFRIMAAIILFRGLKINKIIQN